MQLFRLITIEIDAHKHFPRKSVSTTGVILALLQQHSGITFPTNIVLGAETNDNL